jgi:hypothetical protein
MRRERRLAAPVGVTLVLLVLLAGCSAPESSESLATAAEAYAVNKIDLGTETIAHTKSYAILADGRSAEAVVVVYRLSSLFAKSAVSPGSFPLCTVHIALQREGKLWRGVSYHKD